MDDLLGRIEDMIDNKTLLMVISDHGFVPFKRGVNLNTWLFQNGYLSCKDGKTTSGDWFADVDWKRTKAYSLGLSGIFINQQGREACGIVGEGDGLRRIKSDLIDKLTGLMDNETGDIAIGRVVDTENMFSGPYRSDGPDLLICYNKGYRTSWGSATGSVNQRVFEDNTKHWSGDHSVDPEIVPGIFFANKRVIKDNPDIRDIGPTILNVFGVDIPGYMQGEPLIGGCKKKKQARSG